MLFILTRVQEHDKMIKTTKTTYLDYIKYNVKFNVAVRKMCQKQNTITNKNKTLKNYLVNTV